MPLTGDVIKKYLIKWRNLPDLTLAKKIYKEHPKLFTNIDSCRSIVRYYRGHNGNLHRKKIIDKTNFKELTYNTNPFGLPESYESIRQDYILPKSANNILLLSDIHLPYHNINAITTALEYGSTKKCNTLLLNGDIIDMYQASFHEKDPRKRSISDELQCFRDFLKSIKKHFPHYKIYYKEGNHEARLKRYLRVKAPELLDCEEFELPLLLKFKENGIEWIPNKQIIKSGKLFIMHGNEFKGSGGVNPARAYYLKGKVSMIAGDKHQTSEHTEASLDESMITCWSTGCLCELHADYMPYNKWNLGAARIVVHDDGGFNVHNFRIIKGKIV